EDPQHGRGERSGEEGEEEVAGGDGGEDAHVPAGEIQGAVGEVDDPHQHEDEGETAGEEEEQRSEAQAVQRLDQERVEVHRGFELLSASVCRRGTLAPPSRGGSLACNPSEKVPFS